MNHETYQEQISLYVDHALDDQESAMLFAHLSHCDDCRAFMKLTLRVHTHVVEEGLAEVPLSLDRRVFESVRTNSHHAKRGPWYAPVWFTRISIPLPAAASILFLIIVGSLLFSPILAQAPQPQPEIPPPLVARIPPSLQKQLDLNR